jgi:uncharacterized phiE125 gp8 family phage protein
VLYVAPATEPLSVQEVRDHLRYPVSYGEDALIERWIQSARIRAEIETGRQLITATWDVKIDAFPEGELELPYPPVQQVVSVSYVDQAGAVQVWGATNYQVSTPRGPTAPAARLCPVYGVAWPTTKSQTYDAVTIRIKAGYGDTPETVPAPILTAMLIMIGDLAEGRQSPQRLTGGSATLADDVVYRLRPYWVRPVSEEAA